MALWLFFILNSGKKQKNFRSVSDYVRLCLIDHLKSGKWECSVRFVLEYNTVNTSKMLFITMMHWRLETTSVVGNEPYR